MEREYYTYDNDFIQNGAFCKDQENNKFRFNRDPKGQLRGGQIELDKKGNLLSIRYVDENDNCQTFLYRNGEVVSKFQEKIIDGEYVKHGAYEQYKNGIVVKIGQYNAGNLDGKWITLNDSNKIDVKRYSNGKDVTSLADIQFKKGLVNNFGEMIESIGEDPIRATKKMMRNIVAYLAAGKEDVPQIKINFKEIPELQIGDSESCYCSFYKDGSPKLYVDKVTKIEDGKLEYYGNFFEHYDNGKIKTRARYNKEGKLEGEYKSYHENGQVKMEGQYLNGEAIGNFKYYDENGKVIDEKFHTKYGKENTPKQKDEKGKKNIRVGKEQMKNKEVRSIYNKFHLLKREEKDKKIKGFKEKRRKFKQIITKDIFDKKTLIPKKKKKILDIGRELNR